MESKTSFIHASITNGILNFKLPISESLLEKMNISNKNKNIIMYYNYDTHTFLIKSGQIFNFKSMNIEEKSLQVFKFKEAFKDRYNTNLELLNEAEKYFGVSYRTIYRLTEGEVDIDKINETELIEEQNNEVRNAKVIFNINKNNGVTGLVTLPNKLMADFLFKQTYKYLGIRSLTEIISVNKKFKAEIILVGNEITIKSVEM